MGFMTKKSQLGSALPVRRRRPNGLIPMAAVRRMVRQIAEKFQPEKVILFGSYAYGTPNEHSDIDILVVMPAKNEINQAVRIRQKVEHPFPLDLIVRTPETLSWRLREGDWFLREIVDRGKTLYAKSHRRMGPQGRRRLPGRTQANRNQTSD
jgi:uncharacterized protein